MKIPFSSSHILQPFKNLSNLYENFRSTLYTNGSKIIVENFGYTHSLSNRNTFKLNDTSSLFLGSVRDIKCFPKKPSIVPIKCKLKCNDLGKQIAEPYYSKTPTPLDIQPLTKDFSVSPKEICEKLQSRIYTIRPDQEYTCHQFPSPPSYSNFRCPNALSKYLKRKGTCEGIYTGRSSENTCKKPPPWAFGANKIYTGKDCDTEEFGTPKGPECEGKEFPKVTLRKKLTQSIRSKLKSKGIIKSSAFINEDLILETTNILRGSLIGPIQKLTSLKTINDVLSKCQMSSEEKFGVQKISKTFSTSSVLNSLLDSNSEVVDRNRNINQCKYRKKFDRKTFKRSFNIKNRMNVRNMRANSNWKKEIEPNLRPAKTPINLDHIDNGNIENIKKKTKKLKNQSTSNNVKSKVASRRRKRRSRFWFSRIPIEPNVKGSVIFANGNAEILEDPCKILSVNFCNSDDVLPKTKLQSSLTMNSKLDEYSYIGSELSLCNNEHSLGFTGNSKEIQKNNEENTIRKEDNISTYGHEVIVRQLKISRLNRSIDSYTTTDRPWKHILPSKDTPIKRFSSTPTTNKVLNSEQYERLVSTIDSKYIEGTENETETNIKEMLQNSCSDTDAIMFKTQNFNQYPSVTSFIHSKTYSHLSKDKEDVNFVGKDKFQHFTSIRTDEYKRQPPILPALTRPVTHKNAELDILKANNLAPISKTWKRRHGHSVPQSRQMSSKPAGKSKSQCEKQPMPKGRKIYEKISLKDLPVDHNYDKRAPLDLARKWGTMEYPIRKDDRSPMTSEDLKNICKCIKCTNAAALNRQNFEECKKKLKSKKSEERKNQNLKKMEGCCKNDDD